MNQPMDARRYHRDLVLFTGVWTTLGAGTFVFAGAPWDPAALEAVALLMGGPLGYMAALAAGCGMLLIGIALSRPPRSPVTLQFLLAGAILAALAPLYLALIIYVVFATAEMVTGLLVVSLTFAWPGVANLLALRMLRLGSEGPK